MKDYCTAAERTHVIKLFGAISALDEILKEWGDRGNLSPTERKSLKTARTMANKGFEAIISRLGSKQARLIIDAADRYLEENKEEYCVNREQMDTMIEGALSLACSPCTRDHDRKCPWRKMYQQFNVPKSDEKKTKKGQCPWEHGKAYYTFHLPAKVGERIEYLDGSEWRKSYIDCISGDNKGWLVHIAASGSWLDVRDIDIAWRLLEVDV